jgi:hypothetical protein
MAAPQGNQFWKLRNKHGRDALFASPELLWEAACEYFQWCDETPWVMLKETVTDKGINCETKPIARPYSKSGLYLYIECSETWLVNFKKECSKDFLRVIEQIEKVIDTQQFEGATVGAFNANIIARTLGLKDRTEISGDADNPVTFKSIKFGE